MAETVETQDVVSVGSRVSWGAILAGAFVALTLCIFLGFLGAAINITTTENTDTRPETLATGSGIWTIVTLLVALFVGGFVASRTTVGERKHEAAMYGVLVWAALVGTMVLLGAVGANTAFNFNSTLRQSTGALTQSRLQTPFTAEELRESGWAGATAENATRLSERVNERLRKQGRAAENQVSAMSDTAKAWWSFAAIGFSLFAAIAGALVGAGPEFVLRYWNGRRLVAPTTNPPHHA